MEELGKNYAEYTVKRKIEGKARRNMFLCIALYAVLIVAYVLLLSVLKNFGVLAIIITFPFIPAIYMILRGQTWDRFVLCNYKYEINAAKITLTELRGRKKTEMFTEFVSAFEKIVPVTPENAALAEGADKVIDFRSTVSTPDGYMLVLNKEGTKTVVYIEAVQKALDVMKYYNSKAIVMAPVRY